MCLAMSEGQPVKACCSYLSNFISQSRETEQAAVVQNYGEALILRILISLGMFILVKVIIKNNNAKYLKVVMALERTQNY